VRLSLVGSIGSSASKINGGASLSLPLQGGVALLLATSIVLPLSIHFYRILAVPLGVLTLLFASYGLVFPTMWKDVPKKFISPKIETLSRIA